MMQEEAKKKWRMASGEWRMVGSYVFLVEVICNPIDFMVLWGEKQEFPEG
jgi:hypothetical protein